MLADELDEYKGQGNQYVDSNIQEIQKLYKEVEQKKELNGERVKDKEVILIKPYEESMTTSKTTESSFIYEEIQNLEWYMKFIHSPMQTSVKTVDDGLNFYFRFLFYFLFFFSFSFLFLFLEQLGLGVISHAVTSVTT